MDEKRKRPESRTGGELRRPAEERLRRKQPKPTQAMTDADVRALVHELQVHQIELEKMCIRDSLGAFA